MKKNTLYIHIFRPPQSRLEVLASTGGWTRPPRSAFMREMSFDTFDNGPPPSYEQTVFDKSPESSSNDASDTSNDQRNITVEASAKNEISGNTNLASEDQPRIFTISDGDIE